MADSPHHLGASDFIALTTFRRSGEGVSTPVWVVPDGDDLAVLTPAGTGKLKRLAHTDRVTLAECSRRGRVDDGVVPLTARADVTDDPAEVERVVGLLAGKYGLQFRLFMLVERVVARGQRPREVIRITLDESADEAAASA